MKKIKTFEAACKALKIEPVLPDVSSWPEAYQVRMIAEYKLMRIAEALNEGWTPNWGDTNEWKYYPYFEHKASGFAFGLVGSDCDYSAVSSRLCFKSSELAEYIGKQFISIYNDFLSK